MRWADQLAVSSLPSGRSSHAVRPSASTSATTDRLPNSTILNMVPTPASPANYTPAPAAPATLCEFTIAADLGGLRLDQALARLMPEHSRSRIRTWIDAG